ncbi:hypothetical protein I4U23_005882 [Adineta vaga]|nr:hypothetical protein I4U23_005882 [Adineta vaga]
MKYLLNLILRRKYSLLLILFIFNSIYYFNHHIKSSISIEIGNLSENINVIDLGKETKENFSCIQTKRLLDTIQTTICLHDSRDAVSNEIRKDKIWEEKHLNKLFQYLIDNPHMNFIDIGANLGAYTMFVASLGRQVISIECFKPNIERIRRAIQIEKVQNKVILIGNAIYSFSGEQLALQSEPNNIGSQGLDLTLDLRQTKLNETYIVKTILFNDILPILKIKNIRHAIMKVDIQWSEMYICQRGSDVFDYVNIPIVFMEWDINGKGRYEYRLRFILKFFLQRNYIPTADMCKTLQEVDALSYWPVLIFYLQNTSIIVSNQNSIIIPIKELSQYVDIIDLGKETKDNFSCIQTKRLLDTIQTTICLHDSRDAVSNEIRKDKIWEEQLLTRLLKFLKRFPHMNFLILEQMLEHIQCLSFIRTQVISIECFKPNIERIRRAIQIEKVQNKVILIGNAIYSVTGRYFKMRSDPMNVGSQAVLADSKVNQTEYNNIYVVRTIQFDDILPILKTKNIRHAIMKVDIQWAEIHLCQKGNEIFHYVNIPVILIEWDLGSRLFDRFESLLKCFISRHYVATSDLCNLLPESEALKTWPSHFYWMKMNRSEICS